MTRLTATLLVISAVGCASRPPYSRAYDSKAVAEWRGGAADRCVFGNVNAVCLRSIVAPSGAPDVERFVVAGIREHVPEFQNSCNSADRTEVQAFVGTNACIDCGPDARVPNEASATVLAIQKGIGLVDEIQWVDERGGTFAQMATRLGAAVGTFIVESANRCAPPNLQMQPTRRMPLAGARLIWHR